MTYQPRTYVKKLEMANKNSIWVREDTELNIKKIIKHLEEDYQKTKKKRKISISKLAELTGLNKKSVSSAIYIICFRKKPRFLMFAEPIKTKSGKIRTSIKVKMR